MEKSPGSQFGLFNPRVLLAFILCSVAVFLAALGFATTPSPPRCAAITPPNIAHDNALNTVTCASASDCWAIGNIVAHWDGGSWSAVPGPTFDDGEGDQIPYVFYGVTCPSTSQCWAAGDVIAQWDGSAWSVVPTPGGGPLKSVT